MFTESNLSSLVELINASMTNSSMQNGALDDQVLKVEEANDDYEESGESPALDNDVLWKLLQNTLGLPSATSVQNGNGTHSTNAVIDAIAERNQVTERVGRQLTDMKLAIIALTKAMDDMRREMRQSPAQAQPRKIAKRSHFDQLAPSPSTLLSLCTANYAGMQSESPTLESALTDPAASSSKPRKDAYGQLKSVGISVIIDGETKLARQCSVDAIASAVREKQPGSEPVFYKGTDVRCYASKFQDVFVVVLNDARLFGRHVADFLWPAAHFKDHIIKSRLVTSRSKKDSMGKPKVFVPADEEEVFYGLLSYLGGMITTKSLDFAEACRAAVNQRGNEHKRTDGTPNPAYYHSAFGPGFVPLFAQSDETLAENLKVD